MTKLLQNKSIIKFLGIALSILLIVALVPQINIAYGSKDDVVTDTPTAETGDNATAEGEESAEGDETAEGVVDTSQEAGAQPGDIDPNMDEPESNEPSNSGEGAIALMSDTDEKTPAPTKARAANSLGSNTIDPNDANVNDSNGVLTISGGSHTLTVNGTLERDIVVKNGATLTITGKGTIKGSGKGSVIIVEGRGSSLIFGEKGIGPKVTGGKGSTAGKRANESAELGEGYDKVGGGILVRRADNEGRVDKDSNNGGVVSAALTLNGGTIDNNEANAGGGIFIDRGCGFTMNGGTVSNNIANKWEGGGIFLAGSYDGSGEANAKINAGTIIKNTTKTRFSWGGGGLFVENMSKTYVGSTIVTNNTAEGLGGGVSGCPHATIGIGELNETIAVYRNTAKKDSEHQPHNRWLHNLGSGSDPKSGDLYAFGDSQQPWMTKQDNYGPSGSTYNYKASEKSYSKNAFSAARAMDFYCTKASFVLGNRLVEDETNAPAFTGIKANKHGYELLEVADGEMLEAEEYSVGLTHYLTTHKDVSVTLENYSVIISGNTSYTHGGGIGCNGMLMFGEFQKNDFVNPYKLSITKKIVNATDNSNVDLKGESFAFKLRDKNGNVVAAAHNDEGGKVSFDIEDDTLKQEEVTHERTFTLVENLTEGQKAAGYQEIAPIQVTVTLTVSMSETKKPLMATTTKVYTPVVESVTFGNNGKAEVINKIDPQTSISLPFEKTIDGINGGTFNFELTEMQLAANADPSSMSPSQLEAKPESKSTASLVVNSENLPVKGQFERDYKQEDVGTHWYLLNEAKDDNRKDVSFDEAAYLYKVKVELVQNKTLKATVDGKWKADSADGQFAAIRHNGTPRFENVAIKYDGFDLSLTKQILSTLDDELELDGRQFDFELYEGNPRAENSMSIAAGKTDANGALTLAIANTLPTQDNPYAKQVFGNPGGRTFAFTLHEAETAYEYMETIQDAKIEVTLSASGERVVKDNHTVFLVTPKVESIKVNGIDVKVANNDIMVTNRYAPNGTWQFQAKKFFYGLGEPSDCSFSLVEIERAPGEDEAISSIAVKKDLENKEFTPLVASVTKDKLATGEATIEFPAITYVAEGKGKNQRNDIGDHYYLVTENGDDAAKDTTAYVIKVTVAVDENDPAKLTATETVRGYADDLDSTLNPLVLPEGERPAFYNTDTYDLISAASYSVYAASGEPVDQVCYVDPKIVKNLEGRAIKSGEFAFKLIQVANYNDTEGELISATTNDEFGMVDFDKANNVSGDLENPSCLAYTKPGTYYYRVIEDTSKGGMNDQSVLYSDQVITFTTVIKQDEATGQLVCTDMYYGWWDAATNQNVRFDEQYADYETQPGNIGDMSKLNPDWHPTINNKARPMDLQVRKTSVSDRDEGLVGATYALYMVNENPQGDIWLAEATSEEGGWITYKNVSLATNNLYYFKETAAPAGHTVSEFRSPYFYLVEDATSANGYALKYTDTKYFDAAEVEAAAIPMAAAEAQAMQADIAAQAEAAATDDQTQPGHSADGNILLTYDKDGGVYDETTQVEVNKLDTRTHEWVEGAKLVILEKESGKEVASWTSGKAPQKLAKTLNVGITYLLREVEAPGEYRLANDVEFVIDNYGNVSITKGTENGNAELSDNTITLYDTMMDAEEVEQRERETTREVPLGTILAQTGDMLPILGIGAIVLASLIALIVAGRRRHEGKDDKN